MADRHEANLVAEAGKVRGVVVVFVALFVLASPPEMVTGPRLAWGALGLALVWSAVFRPGAAQRRGGAEGRALVMLLGDLGWMTVLMLGTGGFSGPLALLPLVVIVSAAVLLGSLPLALPLMTALVAGLQTGAAALQGPEVAVTWELAGRLLTIVAVGWLGWALAAVLERERQTAGHLVAQLQHGVALLDGEGRVRLANPRLAELAGMSAEELLGRRADTLPRSQACARALLGAVRGCEAGRRVVELGGEAGREVRVHTLPCAAPGGGALGWVVVAEEVGELRELARRQEEGLAVATHELRSPLSALRALFQVLTRFGDRLGEQERGAALRAVDEELRRLSEMVSRMTDTTALERGILELQPERTDPAALVRRVAESLGLRAAEQGVELRCEIAGELPAVEADPVRLEMALCNLGGNAIKYTPPGGVVTLRAGQEGDWLRLAVEDTGPGIPEVEQGAIFEKYVRGEAGGNGQRHARGLGLGLYVTRKIAELHGGEVRLQSRPGEGSVFELWLPLGPRARLRRAA